MKTIKERFMENVSIGTDCWEWTGCQDGRGYGRISVASKPRKAHRLSYELFVGDPSGMFVCHSCDNRKCVNPAHLFLGTASDNLADMGRKGRQRLQVNPEHARGEKNNQSLLTTEKVKEIKRRLASGEPKRSIADSYGVRPCTIYSIAEGRNWSHVTT